MYIRLYMYADTHLHSKIMMGDLTDSLLKHQMMLLRSQALDSQQVLGGIQELGSDGNTALLCWGSCCRGATDV